MSKQDKLIAEVLDFDNWTETSGVIHLLFVVCPHCGHRFQPEALAGKGWLLCGWCGKQFTFKTIETTMGLAWMTTAEK